MSRTFRRLKNKKSSRPNRFYTPDWIISREEDGILQGKDVDRQLHRFHGDSYGSDHTEKFHDLMNRESRRKNNRNLKNSVAAGQEEDHQDLPHDRASDIWSYT